MDFCTPSVKQVSDLFMYLYQDQNRCPSTIDGYCPLLTPWAQQGSIFLIALTLTGYFLAFTGIFPKVPGISPSGTFLFLNELMRHPFEPMKNTDLKHLTLKTAFLLALASDKRWSKIHAWVANKVSHLGQWEKVA